MTSINTMKLALEALEAVSMEMTVGERYTNAGQQVLDAIELLRVATTQQPATTEPVYWEWRHLSTHPDTVDFGKWSEWKRIEARSAIHTIDDALAEFRAYIAQGYKYELRPLYTHPAPSVPEQTIDKICYLATEIRFAKSDDAAQAVIDSIRAMLAAKEK